VVTRLNREKAIEFYDLALKLYPKSGAAERNRELSTDRTCESAGASTKRCDLLGLASLPGEKNLRSALNCACANPIDMSWAARECVVGELKRKLEAKSFGATEVCHCAAGGGEGLSVTCGTRDELNEQITEAKYLADRESRMSSPERTAFAAVQRAAARFRAAFVASEDAAEPGCCGGGDGATRSGTDISTRRIFRETTQIILDQWRTVGATVEQARAADARLNISFQKRLVNPDASEGVELLRTSQRAWIKYRDAWLELVTALAKHANFDSHQTRRALDEINRHLTSEQAYSIYERHQPAEPRASIGVIFDGANEDRVKAVVAKGPAEKAGIERGDRLRSVRQHKTGLNVPLVNSDGTRETRLLNGEPGTLIKLTVVKADGRVIDAELSREL
jgi:hypothetical protein